MAFHRALSLSIAPFVLGLFALPMVGCYGEGGADSGENIEGVENTYMSFEDFEATVYQEPETGIYIVDGDTPVETRDQLMEFYEQHVLEGALAVNRVGSADDKWSDTQKLNLTYCVSNSFGSNQALVVGAMASATEAWQQASHVQFVYKADQNASCNASNTNVVFDVNPVSNRPYLARAFFPSDARANRNILIDSSAFGYPGFPTLTGLLRHELGHTLGFRHEHTRPEAAVCFEDSNWRALTSYDSSSVMHYPHCNGTHTGDLTLTQKDKDGAASLYGGVVWIFEHANYQGAAQALLPGWYDMGQITIGNDTLSSIKVPNGWTVALFQHMGFSGSVIFFAGEVSYVGNGFNDITSSIVVTAP